MSDGNYNKSILPYNNYQSGVRAGRSQMMVRAVESFREWYVASYPQSSSEEIAAAVVAFRAKLLQ